MAVEAKVVLAAVACTAAASYGLGAILMKRATLTYQPLPASAAVHVAAAAVLVVPAAATAPSMQVPLFGVTWGSLFLGEPVTAGMLPGCLLVLAATALVTGFNPFRAAPPEL